MSTQKDHSERIKQLEQNIEDERKEKTQTQKDALAEVTPDVTTESVTLQSGKEVDVRVSLTKTVEDAQSDMDTSEGANMQDVIPYVALMMEEMIHDSSLADAELWVDYYREYGFDNLMDELDIVMGPYYEKQEQKLDRNQKFRGMGR